MSIEEIVKPIADLISTMENGDISNLLVTMFHLGLITEQDLQKLEDHYDFLNKLGTHHAEIYKDFDESVHG